jgi:hypothetical protein
MADRSFDRDQDATAAGSDDPRVIRSVAVTVEDVVTALEANRSGDRGAVLRITPPFSGRMRARIHIADADGGYTGDVAPIHLDPDSLVVDVPAYPTADETAGAEIDVELRRQRHTERLTEWRETVSKQLRDELTVATDSGTVDVRVVALG